MARSTETTTQTPLKNGPYEHLLFETLDDGRRRRCSTACGETEELPARKAGDASPSGFVPFVRAHMNCDRETI